MKRTKLLFALGVTLLLTQIIYSQVGVGTTSPTAKLQIAAGTAVVNTAPLKLTAGTNLTTPESGAVEFDGTNYYASSGSTRYTLSKTLTASSSLNFPSLNAGTTSTLTVTITGAQVNDPVALGIPIATITDSRLDFQAWVSAADTVTIRVTNLTLGTINPPAGTFKVAVLKF
ncbi:hypothetical protein [Flavobacterium sp.]|uniref:hypothetical protein n=1 Tax=Flavobacterium sp. TaxID=239 RepID=UPI003D6AD73D